MDRGASTRGGDSAGGSFETFSDIYFKTPEASWAEPLKAADVYTLSTLAGKEPRVPPFASAGQS